PISCVYCGGVHDRPADVKQCWAEHPGDAAPSAQSAPSARSHDGGHAPERGFAPERPQPDPVATHRTAVVSELIRGPEALGRHVVVRPRQPEPDAWRGCRRVVVDDACRHDPAATVDDLRAAAHDATSLIVELATDLDEVPAVVDTRDPYEVG